MIGLLDTALSLGARIVAEHTADSGVREADWVVVANEKSPLEEKLLTGRKQVDNLTLLPLLFVIISTNSIMLVDIVLMLFILIMGTAISLWTSWRGWTSWWASLMEPKRGKT